MHDMQKNNIIPIFSRSQMTLILFVNAKDKAWGFFHYHPLEESGLCATLALLAQTISSAAVVVVGCNVRWGLLETEGLIKKTKKVYRATRCGIFDDSLKKKLFMAVVKQGY